MVFCPGVLATLSAICASSATLSSSHIANIKNFISLLLSLFSCCQGRAPGSMYVFISFGQYDLANSEYQTYYTTCQLCEVSPKKLLPMAHLVFDLAEWPDRATDC